MAAIAKETGFKLNPVIAVLIASISPGNAMTASVAANAANAPAIDSIAILTVSASIIPPKASDMLSEIEFSPISSKPGTASNTAATNLPTAGIRC